MKTLQPPSALIARACALGLVCLAILGPQVPAYGQGPLTPPGAPAPTMKTLDQVEPRTPISTAPFTINAAGSYYLTANLTVATGTAMTINADNVTLDLNGFAISSTASPSIGSGININGVRKNLRIRNGSINGTTTFVGGTFTTGGFTSGIFASSVDCRGILISDIHVHGTGNAGIVLGDADVPTTAVERCTVSISGNFGIVAHSVRSSSATDCDGIAIWGVIVTDSNGSSLGSDSDDHGLRASEVSNSRGIANSGTGIAGGNVDTSRGFSSGTGEGIAASGSVSNSSGTSVGNTGINAVANVTNSLGMSTGGNGITGANVSNSRGTSLGGAGISGTNNISNSTGTSNVGIGISGSNITNSLGTSVTGSGLVATGSASYCRGKRDGGTAINAAIAIACTVDGTGTVTSPSKHLGTP